jgi:hypothetical protein
MNISKFLIATLLTLTFSLNINAATTADGGPRTVIQAMTTVIVEQSTPTNLQTTIINDEGNAVIEVETEATSTLISVEDLPKGNYTVETVDDNGDYQAFSITVE